MVVAILQSNYLPWKGYFDIIAKSDVFVIYDSVQYTRRDWRNRNLIKTAQGTQWITVPVESKGNYSASIREMEISGREWIKQHTGAIKHAYAKAPFGKEGIAWIEALLYQQAAQTNLSACNCHLLKACCEKLGIKTPLIEDKEFDIRGTKTEALLSIVKQIPGATRYLSGPAARVYLQEDVFNDAGYEVEWMDYSGYSEYPQLHPPFIHGVSIIDLIMNTGNAAPGYLNHVKK
jgi:hypothetical protein